MMTPTEQVKTLSDYEKVLIAILLKKGEITLPEALVEHVTYSNKYHIVFYPQSDWSVTIKLEHI